MQALTNGTLDLAVIAAEFYANYVDEAGCLCLPFVYSSYDDCAEKLAGEAGTTVAQMILDKTNCPHSGLLRAGIPSDLYHR
mgnify:CR=1 FL=1